MAQSGKVENKLLRLQWSNNIKNWICHTTRQRGIYGINSQEISIVDKYLTRYDVNKVKFTIGLDRCEVGVYLGIPYESDANLTGEVSKLLICVSSINLVLVFWLEVSVLLSSYFLSIVDHKRKRQAEKNSIP